MEEIIRRIKIFEGFSEKPYVCPAGKWTIGYGYNYQDRGFSTETLTEVLLNGFTEETASEILSKDVENCIDVLRIAVQTFNGLCEARRAVLIDMAYQLGINGLKTFKRMLRAIESGDFETASTEMENSRWYKQSGRRSIINTKQMKTGQWQEV